MTRPTRLVAMAGLGVLLLAGLGLVSLFVGSGDLAAQATWAALRGHANNPSDAAIIWQLRLPRLPVALVSGAGLGAAGALTQTLTRNPLAEPGLLGVNAGAALAVATGMLLSNTLGAAAIVALAMAGAAVVGIGVLLLSGTLRGRHNTTRLVLSGAALSAVTSAATSWLVISNPQAFSEFRHWDAGAIEPRPRPLVLLGATLVVLAGLAVVPVLRELDALGLGSDMAGALGARPRRTWGVAGAAAVILCAVATALAGPIGFLGLMAPLLVRRFTGPRVAPLIYGSALVGACILLLADIIGRVVVPPREVAAAIVCSAIGAPAFVVVARRLRVMVL